jgi:hypothetical protein
MKRKDIKVDDWKPVHMVVVVDGEILNAVRCLMYIGGKGHESYYSLFSKDDKHIGFVKHSDISQYMSYNEIII